MLPTSELQKCNLQTLTRLDLAGAANTHESTSVSQKTSNKLLILFSIPKISILMTEGAPADYQSNSYYLNFL
jgi:hypothetical protein